MPDTTTLLGIYQHSQSISEIGLSDVTSPQSATLPEKLASRKSRQAAKRINSEPPATTNTGHQQTGPWADIGYLTETWVWSEYYLVFTKLFSFVVTYSLQHVRVRNLTKTDIIK